MNHDYRVEFPVTKKWAYLNHANVSPLSGRAAQRLSEWVELVVENGDRSNDRWFEEIECVRAAAARMIRARAHEIAFLKNTSEGLSLVAEGFPWKAGDNVVCVSGDYPANVYPWMHLREKGVECIKVAPDEFGIQAAEVAKAINSKTRLVSVSYVQFDSGYRADVAAIGGVCRAHGIDFCVDGAQALGLFPIDVKAMGVDYLCANSHKWLMAPQGAALFFIDESKLEKIRPTNVGWKSVISPHDYSQIDFRLPKEARRFECGSFVVPSIISLGGSLSLLEEVSLSAVQDRVRAVTDYLVEQVKAIGGRVRSCRDSRNWSGIVALDVDGKSASAVTQQCLKSGVVVSCRSNHIRVSPHFYNNREDIDRLIEAVSGS